MPAAEFGGLVRAVRFRGGAHSHGHAAQAGPTGAATATVWAFFGGRNVTLFGALLVAVLAIAAPKLVALGVDSARWTWFWLGGAAGLAMLAAAVWTWLTGGGPLDAAIEVDRRCALRERVSSSLALRAAERDTPAGQALIADALRAIERIDVEGQFPIAVGRNALLPLLPAMIALALVLFVDDQRLTNPAAASAADGRGEQIKKSTDALRRKLIARRKQAEQDGLKDAEQLLRRLEQGVRELDHQRHIEKKATLVKLNDLARQLEERRQQIAGSKSVREHLSQLKQLDPGPAERLTQALRKGDYRQAAAQLSELQQQIRGAALGAAAEAQLVKQLRQIQDKLNKLSDAHQTTLDALRSQINEASSSGNRAEAERCQRLFDQLTAQQPQMDQLADLATKLGSCAQSLQQGDRQGAVAALDQLAADFAALEAAQDELDLMDDVLMQIGACKGAMACSLCRGVGCSACQGLGGGLGGQGSGHGLGQGRGVGPRPEEPTTTNLYDSQVRQQPGAGHAVITGLVDGPHVKGHVLEAIQAEFEQNAQRQADPLADRRLPRAQREHAQEFFDRFREGTN
ncbi:MAG: hypothetical protein A2W31_12810 [Planctomycetes bacterium RBG_16_64_10]|nr:MAG: hypothetical protein A2W31_12810 [Planctomycetes bacterium RBG_16_64_10]